MEDVMDIKFATLERRYLETVEKYRVYKKLKTFCKSMIKVPLRKTKFLT
jgi:hypothetical protein